MHVPTKLLSGTFVLSIGRVSGYGLSFLRNVILARTLAKVDFGLAAVLGMAMVLLEVGGRMAFGQQIIQSKFGATPRFQATAHSLQVAGGLCSAILIIVFSVPLARWFGVPDVWWALAACSCVPLCQGLSHLDIARRQREMDYLPLVLVDVVPQIIITAAAWPLAIWLGDYRVVVWLIIGKALLGAALTFGFAQQPYRWAWERDHVRSMIAFGWPLLLNGLVMFGCQQADQMLVGAAFSLEVLASYALAFSLVSIPWLVFGQVLSSLMLPLMSRAQDDPDRLRRQYRLCAQVAAVGGVVLLTPLIVGGEQLVRLVYGAKYHGTGAFVALLGAAAAVRFLRFAPAVAALAKADTINQLYSNIWRGMSLPLALAVWLAGGSPLQIAACAVGGEVLATLVSLKRLKQRQGISLRESYAACSYVASLVSLSVMFSVIGGKNMGVVSTLLAALGSFIIALAAARLIFPEMVSFITLTLRRKVQPDAATSHAPSVV